MAKRHRRSRKHGKKTSLFTCRIRKNSVSCRKRKGKYKRI